MVPIVIISNNKPHLYEKWGLDIQSMATSRLRVILMELLIYNSIKLQQNEMQQKTPIMMNYRGYAL